MNGMNSCSLTTDLERFITDLGETTARKDKKNELSSLVTMIKKAFLAGRDACDVERNPTEPGKG